MAADNHSLVAGHIGYVRVEGNPRIILPARQVTWPTIVGRPPKLAAGFQPRIQAQEISQAWADGSRSVVTDHARVVLITGRGGVGKSQLAASVFEDRANVDCDLRLWVRAESRVSVLAAFAEAADRVQAPVVEDANVDQKAFAFLNWLAVTDRSWLVVFDNVCDPSQLSGLWPNGQGHVLATTYRRDAALVIGTVTTVKLEAFTPDEANSYIERRIRNASRNGMETALDVVDEAGDLARDLEFLPVALAQAISVILYQAIRCTDYRVNFADRVNHLSTLFPDRLPADEYERTVATTWSLALEQADSMAPKGMAGRMLQLMAVTDSGGVPETVVLAEPSTTYLSGAFSLQASGDAASSVSPGQARSVLRILHSLSLIEHQIGAPATVWMHGLTQRAVRESQPAAEFGVAMVAIADSIDAVWTASERDRLAVLLSNVEHLIEEDDDMLWIGGPHAVFYRAGRSMLDARMAGAAVEYFEWLATQVASRLGADASYTLATRSNLASAYEAAGRLTDAITLYGETLVDLERVLGEDHSYTLGIRSNLAGAYVAVGRLTDAITLYEETLVDLERVLGSDHPDTLTVRNNLAVAYTAAGRLSDATTLYEETLVDLERVLGPDHPSTLGIRSNLASARKASGKPTDAITLYEEALIDLERVLGPDHPDTLTARNNLASACQAAGELTRAIALFKETSTAIERVLGPDHPYALAARNNVAGAYQAAGKLSSAITLLEMSLVDRTRVLGADHPDTLGARNNLAGAYLTDGNPTDAIVLFEETLNDRTRVLGPDHPDTLATRNNLAGAYLMSGNPTNAILLLEQTLAAVEHVLSPDHPYIRTIRKNLAGVSKITSLEQTLTNLEQLLGPDHSYTLATRRNLASAYYAAGAPARAIKLLDDTLAVMERVLGADHHDTVSARNLASAIKRPS